MEELLVFCSCSVFGVEPIDERIREFISSEITRGFLEVTPVIFGTIKEGIMELLDERFRAFNVEIADSQIKG